MKTTHAICSTCLEFIKTGHATEITDMGTHFEYSDEINCFIAGRFFKTRGFSVRVSRKPCDICAKPVDLVFPITLDTCVSPDEVPTAHPLFR